LSKIYREAYKQWEAYMLACIGQVQEGLQAETRECAGLCASPSKDGEVLGDLCMSRGPDGSQLGCRELTLEGARRRYRGPLPSWLEGLRLRYSCPLRGLAPSRGEAATACSGAERGPAWLEGWPGPSQPEPE
jgi:hypothetical protein